MRRAKAAAKLGEVESAMRDLRCVVGAGDAAQAAVAAALLRPLENQLREAKREQRRKGAEKGRAFAAGFARALGGGGGEPQVGGAVPQVGGVVPPPAGKLFFEDRPLDGGQRVTPSTLRQRQRTTPSMVRKWTVRKMIGLWMTTRTIPW